MESKAQEVIKYLERKINFQNKKVQDIEKTLGENVLNKTFNLREIAIYNRGKIAGFHRAKSVLEDTCTLESNLPNKTLFEKSVNATLRILVLPFAFFFFLIPILYLFVKIIINFVRFGGEAVANTNKTNPKTLSDVYTKLDEVEKIWFTTQKQ
jgi:hypothetical protein